MTAAFFAANNIDDPFTSLGPPGGSSIAPPEDEQVVPSFDVSAGEIELVRLNLRTQLGDAVPAALITDYINGWVRIIESGFSQEKGQAVTAADFFDNASFVEGAKWLPFWATPGNLPPPTFRTSNGDIYSGSFLKGFTRTGEVGLDTTIMPPLYDIGGAIQAAQDRLGAIGTGRRGGGGRGGGGGGRAVRAFDRAQLIDGATNLWRSTLIDVDEAAISKGVDEFMRRANSFWVKDGGGLDFEAFMVDKIRATTRYNQLYKRKPTGMSDQQYLGQALNVTAQFTQLRPDEQTAQTETTLRQGVSAQAAATRISGSETVQRGSPEVFASAFARTIAGLGGGAVR